MFSRSKTSRSTPAPEASPALGEDKDAFAQLIDETQGAISLAQARLLRKLAREVTQGVVVEVGSFRGKSTVALSYGAAEGGDTPVFAIDPHEPFEGVFGGKFGPNDRRVFYQNMLRSDGWSNVRLVNLSSEVISPGWDKPIGLLWIDGDHSYEGVKRDFECWLPHLLEGAPVAFDDTNRGGPQQLVEELLAEGWTVTHEVKKLRVLTAPR